MSLFSWFDAGLKIGLPMTAMSWLMFNWLYGAGQLHRDAGHQAIRQHLTDLKQHRKTSKPKNGNYLYKQWLFFGGGFYGLAVLWTLLIIEISEVVGFIINFDLQALLADGIIALLVNLGLSQLSNLLAAVFWFAYWPQGGDGSGAVVIPWLVIAYAGYAWGIHLARDSRSLHGVSHLLRKSKPGGHE